MCSRCPRWSQSQSLMASIRKAAQLARWRFHATGFSPPNSSIPPPRESNSRLTPDLVISMKRCPAEFSPLPPAIVCRTLVLMKEILNSPIALSQSKTKNERVLSKTLHNVTKCYTVTRGRPDETMRPASPDVIQPKARGFAPFRLPEVRRPVVTLSSQRRLLDPTS